jgi:hypothetical protein
MLLKNKIYSGIIIVIFILCLIIGLNENIIGKSLGEKLFYLLNFLFFVLLIIGTTRKELIFFYGPIKKYLQVLVGSLIALSLSFYLLVIF